MSGVPYYDNSQGLAPPAGWLRSHIRAWFTGTIAQLNRGEPAPLDHRDMRNQPAIKEPAPFGAAIFRLTRRYDRGAYAYAYRGGVLPYDPIGAGIVYTQQPPIMQPAAIKVPFGDAIFWAPQQINYGTQPAPGGPIYTPAMVAMLAGNPALAGTLPYDVPSAFPPPPPTGFSGAH